ncbi:hypothetical protein [Bordetella sp. FB-8]|uniref:hypothetical protein n=1 Tax=Bordetella sp. FB-8 TaxID=1159870 RepID=UPI00036DAA24|nr:hypothetical protein [Bordetella sp. FB-8]
MNDAQAIPALYAPGRSAPTQQEEVYPLAGHAGAKGQAVLNILPKSEQGAFSKENGPIVVTGGGRRA